MLMIYQMKDGEGTSGVAMLIETEKNRKKRERDREAQRKKDEREVKKRKKMEEAVQRKLIKEGKRAEKEGLLSLYLYVLFYLIINFF